MSGPSSRCAEWMCAAFAVCLLGACSDGDVHPLIWKDGAAADGGGDGEPFTPTSPGRIQDAGDPQRACKALQEAWPTDYAYEEVKLVEHFNKLRMNPAQLCRGAPPAGPLEVSPELTCLARLRLKAGVPARMGNTPSFYVPDLTTGREAVDLDARLEEAELDFDELWQLGELVITNANTAQNIADAFGEQPFPICLTVANPFVRRVGVSRTGHAWVVSFTTQGKYSGRPGPGGR